MLMRQKRSYMAAIRLSKHLAHIVRCILFTVMGGLAGTQSLLRYMHIVSVLKLLKSQMRGLCPLIQPLSRVLILVSLLLMCQLPQHLMKRIIAMSHYQC